MANKVDAPLSLWVLIGSLLITFLLYFPILGNTFLSDDYDSLYRIVIAKELLFRNFLRPIIDISFYFNYLLSGLDAWSYYLLNILIHAFNGWLLYKVALRFSLFEEGRQQLFAIMSAFLFLVYPFHSEGIVWLSGRLSSIATGCALAAIYLMLDNPVTWKKRAWAIVYYLIGLHAYESILLLPALIVVLRYKAGGTHKVLIRELLIWSIVMLVYLVWRYFISGVVYNDYASRMVDSPVVQYGGQALKTIGRTLLPPIEEAKTMIALFVTVVVVVLVLHVRLYQQLKHQAVLLTGYLQLLVVFLITLLIPMLFGVSTRTMEGDRLLYFPACFLCMLLAVVLMVLIRQMKVRVLLLGLLAAGAVYFTIQNNARWGEASALTKETFSVVADVKERPIILVNLPEELEGAFVFRNGFYHALLVKGIDTAGVWVSHYLNRIEQLQSKDTVYPERLAGETFIYPATHVFEKEDYLVYVKGSQNRYIAGINKRNSTLYYWNNKRLVKWY